MRTLAQMTSRVRRHIRDRNANEWTNYEIYEALRDAAWQMWTVLLGDETGRDTLKQFSAPFPFLVDTSKYAVVAHGDYGVPDISMLAEVEWRRNETDPWRKISRAETRRRVTGICRGTEAWVAQTDENQPVSSVGLTSIYWHADTDPGYIEILPEFSSVTDEQFRFNYYCTPVFPYIGDGTPEDPAFTAGSLDDPDGDDELEYELPGLCDRAIEHLAASDLLAEELNDQTQIKAAGFHKAKYQELLAGMMEDTSGLVQPARRYVRKVKRV